MSQLNATFGSGGMSCGFNDSQLTSFVHFLQHQSHPIPVKHAAMIVGRQPNSNVWVFNPNTQVDAEGQLIPYDNKAAKYVWLDRAKLEDKFNKTKPRVPREDICTNISTPLVNDGDELFSDLLTLLNTCMKHNFIPSVLMIGASIMLFHFSTITKKYGGCPIPLAIGPPETGKSTAIKAALSLSGIVISNNNIDITQRFGC